MKTTSCLAVGVLAVLSVSCGGRSHVACEPGMVERDGHCVETDGDGVKSLTDNTVLPTCEATLLEDRLVSLGWEGASTFRGNDDDGTCE